MALTDSQKTSYLFKKLFGKSSTSTNKQFYEESRDGKSAIYPSQIWTQSGDIPTTAPSLGNGETAGVVQKWVDLVLTQVTGVTGAFYNDNLIDAIPFNYGDGSYNYVLKDSTGATITFGSDWLLDPDTGTLTFYGTVPSNMPPKITFFRYVGDKGIPESAGESNTASNLGEGFGIFSDKSDVDLRFKSLIPGNNIELTSDISTITITATGSASGEANTASNLGTGSDGEGVYDSKSGVDLRFKRIKAGTHIVLTSESYAVKIDVDVSTLESDISDLISDLNILQSDVSILQSVVSYIDLDIIDLQSDVSILQSEVSDIKPDISILQSEVSSIDLGIIELVSDVNILQSEVSSINLDVTQFTSDLSILQSDMSDVKPDVSILQSEVSSIDLDIIELQSDVSILQSEISNIAIPDLGTLPSDVSILQSLVSSIELDIVGLESDASILESDMSYVKSDLSAIHSDISALSPIPVTTGFYDSTQVTLSYDPSTRILTMARTGASIVLHYRSRKIILTEGPYTTIAHTDSAGEYYVTFDEEGALSVSTSPWNILTDAPVAYIRYFGSGVGFALYEYHSSERNPIAHLELHEQVGTYKVSGGLLQSGTYVVYSPSSSTAPSNADNTPGIGSTLIADEDIRTNLEALPKGTYTTAYLNGTNWTFTTGSSAPWLLSGSDVAINTITGTNGSLTPLSSNLNYCSYYLIAMPSMNAAYRFFWIPGQKVYTAASGSAADAVAARDQALNEDPRGLYTSGLPSTEWVIIYKLVVQRNSGWATTGRCRICGEAVISGSRSGFTGSGAGGVTVHNNLTGRGSSGAHPLSAIGDSNAVANRLVRTDSDGFLSTIIDGNAGEFLKTDGSGGYSWEAINLSTLQSDVSILQSEVSDIRLDMGGILSDVSYLESDMSDVLSDVSILQSDMSVVMSDIAALVPGGSDTYIQFNDSNSFAGDANFVWDNTNKLLKVTGSATGGLGLMPYGTGTDTTELRFYELDSTNYVGFKAADVISSNQIWVLPDTDGDEDQVIKTDGSGSLGWISVLPLSGGTMTGPVNTVQSRSQTIKNSSTNSIDASTGNCFWIDTSGANRTITVTNLAEGQTITVFVSGQSGDIIDWTISDLSSNPLTKMYGTGGGGTMASAYSIFNLWSPGCSSGKCIVASLHGIT